MKIKTVGRQEFVIGGWVPGKGRRRETIGALLLGVYEDGRLRHVGRVGSGLGEDELERLSRALAPLQRNTSPFEAGPRPPRDAVFTEPELVAEVAFGEWTAGGSLRHPTYEGLRDDKPAKLVVREAAPARGTRSPIARPAGARSGSRASRREPAATPEPLIVTEQGGRKGNATVEGRSIALSNLDKVLYPERGFTKRDLIDYYAAIGPTLLGHLLGRPLTVTRWPDGVEGKSFFQKQAPAHSPDWVRTATLPSGRKPIDYVLAEDLATLVWLANLAAIELHTPLARAPAIDVPSALVFDLDPGAPAGMLECCAVALRLQGLFENLGLTTFPKTSGSKGLQVYLPLNDPQVRYETTKPFARTVAELLAADEPELVVSRMTKARRTGKVLIDWSQNDAKKTTVCVYSLRATALPSASTPLDWDEVRAAHSAGDASRLSFEAHEVLSRVAERGDLFAPVLSLVQELPAERSQRGGATRRPVRSSRA